MKRISRRSRATLEKREARFGYVFLIPWALGFIFLFLGPLFDAIRMTFSTVSITTGGFSMEFVGFKNYMDVLTGESEFQRGLISSIGSMLYRLPIITIFSFFIAVIINQEFHGRYLARAIFFLPVIIASGAVIDTMSASMSAQQLSTDSGGSTLYQSAQLFQMLQQSGFPEQIVNFTVGVVNQTFDLIWRCGIQVLLFLAGLQSIGPQYYEAANVEGATGWEKFWKITFPLISPVTLIVLFYTVVDSFMDLSNYVMKLIYWASQNLQYERGTTMATLYFLIIFGICGIIIAVASKWVFYHDER